jgi:two-component system, cell cycle response regulator DivK
MPKILLVDDDEMSRDMLSRRLIRRGFEVIFAVDGKQGVDTARREKPDIILMDMSLPVRNVPDAVGIGRQASIASGH